MDSKSNGDVRLPTPVVQNCDSDKCVDATVTSKKLDLHLDAVKIENVSVKTEPEDEITNEYQFNCLGKFATVKVECKTEDPLSYEDVEGMDQSPVHIVPSQSSVLSHSDSKELLKWEDSGDDTGSNGNDVHIQQSESTHKTGDASEVCSTELEFDASSTKRCEIFYSCSLCSKILHVQDGKFTDKKHFLCRSCDKDVEAKSEEKKFACEVCKKCFSNKNTLKTHYTLHSGIKPFVCDICNASFIRKDSLQIHSILHTGKKPFYCDVCNKSFCRKSSLRTHKNLHTGEKKYCCHICQRSFKLKNSLYYHVKVHSGEKPFVCDKCNKCFMLKSNLDCHIRIHSSEKPFKCEVCNKSFSEKNKLRAHARVHSQMKLSYSCDLCERRFRYIGNLDNHMASHSATKVFSQAYTCYTCEKKFISRDFLEAHYKVHN